MKVLSLHALNIYVWNSGRDEKGKYHKVGKQKTIKGKKWKIKNYNRDIIDITTAGYNPAI